MHSIFKSIDLQIINFFITGSFVYKCIIANNGWMLYKTNITCGTTRLHAASSLWSYLPLELPFSGSLPALYNQVPGPAFNTQSIVITCFTHWLSANLHQYERHILWLPRYKKSCNYQGLKGWKAHSTNICIYMLRLYWNLQGGGYWCLIPTGDQQDDGWGVHNGTGSTLPPENQ